MSAHIQFFVGGQANERTFEGRVPEVGEEIELDDVRYRVRQVVYAYWTVSGARVLANVYLDAVDGSGEGDDGSAEGEGGVAGQPG